MKYITTVLFGFLTILTAAQNPTPPENLLEGDLRNWLRLNWFQPFEDILSYTESREEMYSYIDNENGDVFCVYSGYFQDSEFSSFLDPINCEHTVPQSFFGGGEPMKSDIHHLFPTHGNVNSARGNLPFIEVNDTQTDTWYVGDESDLYDSSNTPSVGIEDYSELLTNEGFEPREDHKGNVARAVLYFFTMYPSQLNEMNQVADLDLLYQWHLDDPVDNQEILRNEKAQEVQGNYNPYISLPELVTKAWGYFVIDISEEEKLQTNIYPNPVVDFLTIETTKSETSIEIVDYTGQLIHSQRLTQNRLNLSYLPSGYYFIKVKTETEISILEFVKY